MLRVTMYVTLFISLLRIDHCKYLKLTGGTIYAEDPQFGLGIFERVIVDDVGLVEYEAIDGSGFRVWLEESVEAWVIGKWL